MLRPCPDHLLSTDTSEIVSLHLLLFVDETPISRKNIQNVQQYLQSLQADYPFELQVIEIGKQPHLVEHFRLVATPALVKVFPEPRQTIAGTNILEQLKKWWPYWQTVSVVNNKTEELKTPLNNNLTYSEELLRLSDEIFRLKQEKEELLEQLQFKDQAIAMLSHDLRSPLTAASLAMETLEKLQGNTPVEEDPQAQIKNTYLKEHLYRQVKQQFKIMNRMITDLLQAAKSINTKLRAEPRMLHLQSLLPEIVGNFDSHFQAKSLTFKQDIPEDLPPAYADVDLLRQVMVNLLDNAIKYTPDGGTIRIYALHRTTEKIEVSIADTGPGIPEEKQERIFEGHFRLKRDQSQEGYGLGLYLCRKIIRAHYSQIWVDSVPNQGSCFHFTLPVFR